MENLSLKNHENVVYQKLKHLDLVIFTEYLFLESECSFTNNASMYFQIKSNALELWTIWQRE